MPNDVLAVCPFFKSTYAGKSMQRVLRCSVFEYDYINTELRNSFKDFELLQNHLNTFCMSYDRFFKCPYYKIIKKLVL